MIEITVTNRKLKDSRHYKFTQNTILFGRQQHCDVILESVSISRRHAKMTIHKNLVEIEDLGSGNGTSVNKNRIPANEKTLIKPGDAVRIEEFDISFSQPDNHESPQTSKLPQIDSPSQSSITLTNKPADEIESKPKNNPSADMMEIRMIKKVLGALDQDHLPSLSIVSDEFKDQKAIYDEGLHELVIGRDLDCQLSLNSTVISRRHAIISVKWGSYVITDLGSKNGTFVNGERITETSIKDGDEIVFGTIKSIFKNPQEFDFGAISRTIEEDKAKHNKKFDETSSFEAGAVKTEADNKKVKEKSETDTEKPKEETPDNKEPELEKKKKDPKEKNKKEATMIDEPKNKTSKKPVLAKAKTSFSEIALFAFGGLVVVLVLALLLYLFI